MLQSPAMEPCDADFGVPRHTKKQTAGPGIIAGHGTRLACEETVPNSSKSHSAVRHGFAGRGLQYVPGLFSEPAGCAGPNEQLAAWKERSGACGAAFRDSAPR